MFQYDRPQILSATPQTAPIYEYLYKFVEYCNVMLNQITPDQLSSSHDIVQSFVEETSGSASFTANTGTSTGAVSVRKELGLVFLEIGELTNVPTGDFMLTGLPPGYHPAKEEVYDYTTPTWQALRVTVNTEGQILIHSYSASTQATVDAHIRMVYPAAII